jgi:hypothetical protein
MTVCTSRCKALVMPYSGRGLASCSDGGVKKCRLTASRVPPDPGYRRRPVAAWAPGPRARAAPPKPVRYGPATGVGLAFQLAPPEPDDNVLDLHPQANMHAGVHCSLPNVDTQPQSRSCTTEIRRKARRSASGRCLISVAY